MTFSLLAVCVYTKVSRRKLLHKVLPKLLTFIVFTAVYAWNIKYNLRTIVVELCTTLSSAAAWKLLCKLGVR